MAKLHSRNARASAAAAPTTKLNKQADSSDEESDSEETSSNGNSTSEEDSSDRSSDSESNDDRSNERSDSGSLSSDEGSDSESHNGASDEGGDCGIGALTERLQAVKVQGLAHSTYRRYRDGRVEMGRGYRDGGRFYTASGSGNVFDTTSDTTRPPPQLCRNCGGNHGRKDCPRRRRY